MDERDIEQYVMDPRNDQFLKKMSRYFLYFRLGNRMEWASNEKNREHFDIVKKKVIKKNKSTTSTIASKNVFKGDVKVELICSYQTNKAGWFTFGNNFFLLFYLFIFYLFFFFFF